MEEKKPNTFLIKLEQHLLKDNLKPMQLNPKAKLCDLPSIIVPYMIQGL